MNTNSTFLIVDNVIAAQVPKAAETFKQIIKDFDTIIEIGYHRGAFSKWIYQNKKESSKFITYDIFDDARQIFDKEIDFRVKDCFEEKTVQEIKSLIQNSKKVLLLCDGGNKISEFNLYSAFLKSGDVIMLHDYHDASLPESYEDFVGPNWGSGPESHYVGIQKAVNENKLEKYKYDIFRTVIWGSFIKI